MSRTKEQQQGINFEEHVAKVLDGRTTPGSGNQFHSKSDVQAHGLLVSCKSEQNLTWAKIHRHLMDAIDYSQGTGNLPALALEIKGSPIDYLSNQDEIVVMRLADFAKAFEGGVTKIPEYIPSKGIQKRNEANIPVMLRK